MQEIKLSLSVVSHGQIDLVECLLRDISQYCSDMVVEVILTLNIPEKVPEGLLSQKHSLVVLKNTVPLGFGENHNRAFACASSPFFCVINPDIRINSNIFPVLIKALELPEIGVVAPLIVDAEGKVEDSARKFPTPLKILGKIFGIGVGVDYPIGQNILSPDWVGGMFMLLRRDVYKDIGGFDERFFLYYEDVDLCARIRLRKMNVLMDPKVRAIHIARRSSHSNPSYSIIHIRSMIRFFTSITFFKVMLQRLGVKVANVR